MKFLCGTNFVVELTFGLFWSKVDAQTKSQISRIMDGLPEHPTNQTNHSIKRQRIHLGLVSSCNQGLNNHFGCHQTQKIID